MSTENDVEKSASLDPEESEENNEITQNGAEEQTAEEEQEIEEGSLIKAGSNDVGKIFVGGLSWETSTEQLRQYFAKIGDVKDCTIKVDAQSGRSRGFGFVLFEDPSSVREVIESRPHVLDGRTIDPKRAMALKKDNKLFAGGFPAETHTDKLREHFKQFGEIELLERPLDKQTQKTRGFCFVTYKTEDQARAACSSRYQEIEGNKCEVKNAEPQKSKKMMGYGYHPHGQYHYHGSGSNYGGYGDYSGYGPGGYNGGYSSYGYGPPHFGFGGYGYNQSSYNNYSGHNHYGGYQSGGYGGGSGQHQHVPAGIGKNSRRGQSNFKQY